MEITVVQQAVHPNHRGAVGHCALCGEQKPPYLDLFEIPLRFTTAEGEVQTDGRLYVCVGNEDRPGCAVQMLTAIGSVPPWIYKAEKEQMRVALANAAARENEAVNRLVQLRAQLAQPLPSEQ